MFALARELKIGVWDRRRLTEFDDKPQVSCQCVTVKHRESDHVFPGLKETSLRLQIDDLDVLAELVAMCREAGEVQRDALVDVDPKKLFPVDIAYASIVNVES